MKKFFKLLGVIAIVALIGFSMASCAEQEKEDDKTTKGSTEPTFNVKNSTGYDLSWGYYKPSISTHWSEMVFYKLDVGESIKITLAQPLSVQSKYDIRMKSMSTTNAFTKYGVTITNGMTITLTADDSNPETDLPTLTVKNRSGVDFNTFKVKPSSSSDWGDSFDTTSNNYDTTIKIPIPPSNYTEFDIQMGSSNPTNTYTKTNVTLTTDNVLVFTSADKDNPTPLERPVIVIENKTNIQISIVYIRATDATVWGDNLIPWMERLNIDDYFAISVPPAIVGNIDIFIEDGNSTKEYIKTNIQVVDGTIVTFTEADLKPPVGP